MQEAGKRRRVVVGRLDGLFCDRLQPDDLVDVSDREPTQRIEISYPTGESGVHQPIRHLGIGEKHLGEVGLGVLTAPVEVRISRGVPR